MDIFVSVPMRDRTEEEIKADIDQVEKDFLEYLKDCNTEFRFVHAYNKFNEKAGVLYCLGESIKQMDTCFGIVFAHNFENYRGCMTELYVAERYGLKIFHYDNHGRMTCKNPL